MVLMKLLYGSIYHVAMQCMRGKEQTIRIYGRAVSFDLNRAAKIDTLSLLPACGTSRRQASTVAMRRQRSPCI